MRPIAPPPHRPRSRIPRETTRVSESNGKNKSQKNNLSISSWLPFGEDLKTSSSDSINDFLQQRDDEVAISTSCSGEESHEEGNIEIQLNSSLDENATWGTTTFEEHGLLDLTPVPLPDSPRNEETLNNFPAAVRTEPFTTSRATRALPLPRGQKVVHRRGLAKRNEDSFTFEEEGSTSRGRRGRSVSGSRNRARSKSLMKKSLIKPAKRRSRSVLKVKVGQSNEVTESNTERIAGLNGRIEKPQLPPSQSARSVEDTQAPFDEIASANNRPILQTQAAETVSINPSSVCLPRPLHTRNLLATSVYHNEATGIWITTINMSQKESVSKSNAAKYLKAFSFQSESEARESAYANAPARMLPFDENHFCFTCSAQFSVFKRASHCRNCGVCICNNCSVSWNKVCIPETYNIKGESSIKVCKTCDSLSKKFKRALLEADYEGAITIYNTGNINLRCPFVTNKGDEAMLPIHCAVQGGNLDILQWLVEVHFCPLKRIRTGNNKNKSEQADELITTSKDRSVLEIAMADQNVEILRYLVNERNIAVVGIRDLNVALKALEAVLRSSFVEEDNESTNMLTPVQRAFAAGTETPRLSRISNGLPSFAISQYDDSSDCSDDSSKNVASAPMDSDDESVATTVHDACIICYDNSIDCVITPCGHQICCLQCSKNLKCCPVCNVDCKFIRIFRP